MGRVPNIVKALVGPRQEDHHAIDLVVMSTVYNELWLTRECAGTLEWLLSNFPKYRIHLLLHDFEWLSENSRCHQVTRILASLVCEPSTTVLIGYQPLLVSVEVFFLPEPLIVLRYSSVRHQLEIMEGSAVLF